MSAEEVVYGLPTLEPGVTRRRRGGVVVDAAVQLIDLRGTTTDPIWVRATSIAPAPEGERVRALPRDVVGFDVTREVDPVSGEARGDGPHAWAASLSADAAAMARATRRIARAHEGVNLLRSLETRGWSPGAVLTRRQLFPLDPPHLVWLDGEAWAADEVCCVTPDCPCQDLSVDFEPLVDGEDGGGRLSARLSLESWSIEQIWGGGSARLLAERWMAEPGARERARELFDRAHAAGRDLFDPFVIRDGRVQSDARCPCGSHRKFKRCCASASPPPVPGDLQALRTRARRALLAFAAEAGPPLAPSEIPGVASTLSGDESRQAWLLYWQMIDGLTLADRFLADPGRGDLWLRRFIEAANGTPIGIFAVSRVDGGLARLIPLRDPEGSGCLVSLAPGAGLREGDVVLGAPVRLMGTTVLEGAWRAPGSKDIQQRLAHELEPVGDLVERLLKPDRVLQAMSGVLTTAGKV